MTPSNLLSALDLKLDWVRSVARGFCYDKRFFVTLNLCDQAPHHSGYDYATVEGDIVAIILLHQFESVDRRPIFGDERI